MEIWGAEAASSGLLGVWGLGCGGYRVSCLGWVPLAQKEFFLEGIGVWKFRFAGFRCAVWRFGCGIRDRHIGNLYSLFSCVYHSIAIRGHAGFFVSNCKPYLIPVFISLSSLFSKLFPLIPHHGVSIHKLYIPKPYVGFHAWTPRFPKKGYGFRFLRILWKDYFGILEVFKENI